MQTELKHNGVGRSDDDNLARELSLGSGTSVTEIKRVLSLFPEPKKYKGHVFALSDAVIDILSSNLQSAGKLKETINPITNLLLATRQLNETYMGHMTPQPTIPGIWGKTISALVNGQTIAREASQIESLLEPEPINFLIRMVGYRQGEASGVFTGCGTDANHAALTLARLLIEKRAFEKKKKVKNTTILASSYAHYSLAKSVRQLGGINQDIKIEIVRPEDFKMSTSDLEHKLKELRRGGKSIMAIWGIAGETETGKVDDLDTMSKLALKYDVPLIVDGAYGAPYRISMAENKFRGMEEAFSITVDPQKTLYEPFGAGALLVGRVEDHALIGEMQRASYAGFSEGYQNILEAMRNNRCNLGQKRLSGSMGAEAILATLASIRTLGLEGYRTIYNLTIKRILHLYERLSQSDILFPLHTPDINLLCFGIKNEVRRGLGIDSKESLGRYINAARERLDNGILGEGGYHFSTTRLTLDDGSEEWNFRACLMNPRTTNRTVDDGIGQLEENIKQDLRRTR